VRAWRTSVFLELLSIEEDNDMAIERRDFIKSGFAGLSAGLLSTELARAQSTAGSSKGKLEGGTGSVRVEGQLKSGVLKVEAQDFTEGSDRCLIMNGTLGATKLYCSMFSHRSEQTVFAVLRSNDHTTSLVLSDSPDPKISHLVVWNDAEVPGTFRIDKEKYLKTLKPQESIVDGKGDSLDLVGKRNPPPFTLSELEAVFGDNEALNEFMRGHRSRHILRAEPYLYAFACHFVSNIGGSLTGLAWLAP
jgi:hypothetical protein